MVGVRRGLAHDAKIRGGLRRDFRYISTNITIGVVMRLVAALVLLLLASPPLLAHAVIDDAGRRVEVPDRVLHVLPAGPPAAVLLYSFDPVRMIGWPHAPAAEALPYLDAVGRALPEVGALTHGDADPSAVARWHPDLILDVGSVTPRYVALADRVQAATHVPYLLLDGRLERTPQTYRRLGVLLGDPRRGEALAEAAERLLKAATPGPASLGYYYAHGPSGLATSGADSIMVDVPRLIGLRNVLPNEQRADIVAVSREQLVGWHPELVLTSDAGFAAALRSDPAWRGLAESRILLAPRRPFGWIDEPPSVNRLLGLAWLPWALDAAAPRAALEATVRDFYRLFYRVDLDDAQLAELLGTR
jgi:iron complex transport system substrate-binding protein